jgi:hypothetical protein
MGALGIGIDAVDENAAHNLFVIDRQPDTVARFMESAEKFGHLPSDFPFEEQPESPFPRVIDGVHLRDPAQGAGPVSFDSDRLHRLFFRGLRF